jgi:hypothetical protein
MKNDIHQEIHEEFINSEGFIQFIKELNEYEYIKLD